MEYHVARNGASIGTLSEESIAAALAANELSPADLCWREGMADWQPLGSVFSAQSPAPAAIPQSPPFAQAALDHPYPEALPPPPPPETTAFETDPYAPPAARVVAAAVPATQELSDYAGFWIRVAAYIIDWVITNLVAAAGGMLFGLSMVAVGVEDESGLEFGGSIVGIVVSWLYYALMESSARQATLGKMALGLVVTDLRRERISFGRASGRYFGMILSGLLFGIGFLMCIWNERKQCLHDSIAGCLVFRKIR